MCYKKLKNLEVNTFVPCSVMFDMMKALIVCLVFRFCLLTLSSDI